ncbi:MAG: BtrH N-terminal domain-containing protein [Lachnospiraceae bacterium]|nr:BtrH N-terminal domain-containing protein [Lachnospiraceae bacterium]
MNGKENGIEYLQQSISILDGIESFCYQNCLRIVLQFQGLRNSELYLNAALSFGFDKSKEELVTRQHIRSLLPPFSKCVKRKEYLEEVLAEKIFEDNIDYIKKNKNAIIVGVDTYYLEYASNYMKNHARHTLVLCGYNQSTRKVQVIDWYPPWYYKGEVSLEAFLNARASKNEIDGTLYSGNPINNNWAQVDFIPYRTDNELLLLLLEDMVKNHNLCDSDENIAYGVDGLKEFGKFIEKTFECEKLNRTYKKMIVITKRYNFFRMYMRHFDNIEIVRRIILNLDYKIEEWDRISMLVLKTSITNSSRIKEKIHTRIDNLIESDKDLYSDIMELYKNLVSEVEKND